MNDTLKAVLKVCMNAVSSIITLVISLLADKIDKAND